MESWSQLGTVSTERLMDSNFGGGDLVDGRLAAAANARAPYFHTALEAATALETGLIGG